MAWFKREQARRGGNGAHGPRFPVARMAAALGLLLLGAVILIGGRAAAAPQATIIRCDPATVVGPLGSTIDIDIYVENVVDLWAGDVRLGFDTTALRVVDADPASADSVEILPLDTFLSPDYVVKKAADNEAGTIWYAATQMNDPTNPIPKEPVSGSGPLARITFRALRAGQFTLPITYHKIVLRTGMEIPSTAQGCSITFVDADSGGVTFVPFTARN